MERLPLQGATYGNFLFSLALIPNQKLQIKIDGPTVFAPRVKEKR